MASWMLGEHNLVAFGIEDTGSALALALGQCGPASGGGVCPGADPIAFGCRAERQCLRPGPTEIAGQGATLVVPEERDEAGIETAAAREHGRMQRREAGRTARGESVVARIEDAGPLGLPL